MSHWADYLVRDEHGWQLRCSRWAGQELVYGLLLGPAQGLAQIREHRAYALDQLGAAAEAAALIDLPARVLMFYDEVQAATVPERQAWFGYLREAWPGWQVRWAYGGAVDLARYAGLDPAGYPEAVGAPDGTASVGTVADPRQAWTLVTVRRGDGTVRVCPVEVGGGAGHPAMLGPRLLHALEGHGAATYRAAVMPYVGVHLDEVARGLGWWTTVTWPGLDRSLPDIWPGWRIEFWQDRYQEQVGRTAGALELPPVDVLAALDALDARLRAEVASCRVCRSGPCPHGPVLARRWEIVSSFLAAARRTAGGTAPSG